MLMLSQSCFHPKALLLAGSLLLITFGIISFSDRAILPRSLPGEHLTGSHHDLLDDVSNATLGFQKIFVINLASRTDHRDSMSLAAAFTGLEVEYVDGVTSLENKTLPPGGLERGLNIGSLYGWRAHMNVLRLIVEQNITSALILEDDIDWDLRIKSQMKDFARAARLLVQPLAGTTDKFLDPTHPQPEGNDGYKDFDLEGHSTEEPKESPYGGLNRWDLFWLGHCGCRFPRASDSNAPLGRVVLQIDTTVPEHQHLDMEYGNNELIQQYPAHSRVVSRARVNTCSLAYGISHPGARRFLYELGVHKMSDTNDMMFRYVCDGVDDRQLGICLTVQPQLFQHHRPVGPKSGFSDISSHGDGFNDQAFTRNIRWSTRLNFPKLISGATDYIDLFKDGAEKLHLTSG